MKRDKEHLNVDLGFLDDAKPQEAQTKAASTYKVNWRNIAIIGGLIIVFFIWIASNDNSSSQRSTPTSYTPPPSYQPQAPTYQSPADSAANVSNGDFRCSSYDSNQADLMAPKNEFQLTQEEEGLKHRSDALGSLKLQIDKSGVTQYSDQASIDSYNAMVSRYNAQLMSLKADYSSHQARIDIYNQQVQARNNYLLTHCRRNP